MQHTCHSTFVDNSRVVECEGTADRVGGTYTLRIGNESSGVRGNARLDLTLGVGAGRLTVSFDTVDGERLSADVRPGTQAELSGIVALSRGQGVVTVQVEEGDVRDVLYEARLSPPDAAPPVLPEATPEVTPEAAGD